MGLIADLGHGPVGLDTAVFIYLHFEVNDARFWRGGLVSVGDFAEYMRSAFDCLYAEAQRVPRMMSIGLHCRIAGTPARSRAFVDFLEYVRRFPGVWFARRVDIARWWLQHQPPPAT